MWRAGTCGSLKGNYSDGEVDRKAHKRISYLAPSTNEQPVVAAVAVTGLAAVKKIVVSVRSSSIKQATKEQHKSRT